MANTQDKNPSSVRKERDSFLENLTRFHNTRGTPIRHTPCLGGREIDLFSLYNRVTSLGGWEKVNLNERWEEVQEDFNIPRGCTNASQALKNIYIRFLDVYEKIHFLGEDPDRKVGESEEQGLPGQRKKTSYASLVPMMYNHTQHHVSASVRENQNFCRMLEPGMTDKLEKSLLSGLPNEIDFSLNICTLLSSEGKHTLLLDRCSQLLELLLAHVGIFGVGPGSMKELHLSGWKPVTKRNFLRFWWESVEKKEIRQLICPDIPLPEEGDHCTDQCESIEDVLCVGRDLGLNDKEGQRVLQISMILRNLSFEVENVKVLLQSQSVLRFLLLGIHCKYHSIRQLSLDTLGNLCLQMELKVRDSFTTPHVITTLSKCLKSADKFEIVTGLDMLSKLCQKESNEEALCELLPHDIYSRIISYLTVHDIQLIVYTLECLYQLSELGETSTTNIASVSRAVSCLISLVTIEAQSYGPESIKGIKVVEHIPASLTSPVPTQKPTEPAPTPQSSKAINQKIPTPVVAASQGGTPSRPKAVPTPPPPQTMRPPVSATPPPGRPTPPPTPPKADPLLTRWLHCHYEPVDGAVVSQLQIYLGFLRVCGQKRMPDSKQFTTALRVLFPRIDIVSQEKPEGTPEVFLRGIKRRDTPLSFQTERASSMTPPPVRYPTAPRLQAPASIPSPPSTPQPPVNQRQNQPQRLKFIQYKPGPQPTPMCGTSNTGGLQPQGGPAKQFSIPRPPTPLSPLAVATSKATDQNPGTTKPLPLNTPLGMQKTATTTVQSGGQNTAKLPTPQSLTLTSQSQPAPMLQHALLNKLDTDRSTPPISIQTPPLSPHLQQLPVPSTGMLNPAGNNAAMKVQQSVVTATPQGSSLPSLPIPNAAYLGNIQHQHHQTGFQNIQQKGNQYNAGVIPQVQPQGSAGGTQQQNPLAKVGHQIINPMDISRQNSTNMQAESVIQTPQQPNTPGPISNVQVNMNQNQPFMEQVSVPIVPGGFLSQLQMSPPRLEDSSSQGASMGQLQADANYVNQQGINTFPAQNLVNTMPNQQSDSNKSQSIAHHQHLLSQQNPMPNVPLGGHMPQPVANNLQCAVPQGALSSQIPQANHQVPQSTQQQMGSQSAQHNIPVVANTFQEQTATSKKPVNQQGQQWTTNQWQGQATSTQGHVENPQQQNQWHASSFQSQFQQFAQGHNSQENATSQLSETQKTKSKRARPPRVKNQNKTSSRRSSKAEQNQPTAENTNVDKPLIPAPIVDTPICDNRSDESVLPSAQKDRLATDTAVFYKENCPPAINEINNQDSLKPSTKDVVSNVNSSNPHVSVNKLSSVDHTELITEKSAESSVVEMKTSHVHCDANILPSASSEPVNSNIANESQQPNELFNGLSHNDSAKPPCASKELSPLFNSSVEEKKARIAQLMKDTNRLKEQLKGINGVGHHLGNTDHSVQDSTKPDAAASDNISSESQVTLNLINNKHPSHLFNGHPEPVNVGGNHSGHAQTGSSNDLMDTNDSQTLNADNSADSTSNIQQSAEEVGKESLPLGMQVDGCDDGSDDDQMDTSSDHMPSSHSVTSTAIPVYSVPYSQAQTSSSSLAAVLPSQSLTSCHTSSVALSTGQPTNLSIAPIDSSVSISTESQSSMTITATAMTLTRSSVQTTVSIPSAIASSVSASPTASTLSSTQLKAQPSQKLIPIQPRPAPISMAQTSHMISATQPATLLSSNTQLVMAGGVQQSGGSIQINLPPGVPLKGQGYIQCQGQPQIMHQGQLKQLVTTHGHVVNTQSPTPPPPLAIQAAAGQSYVTSQGQAVANVTGQQFVPQVAIGEGQLSSKPQVVLQGAVQFVTPNPQPTLQAAQISSQQPVVTQLMPHGTAQFVSNNPSNTQIVQGQLNPNNTQIVQGQLSVIQSAQQSSIQPHQSSISMHTVQSMTTTPQTLGSAPLTAPHLQIPQPRASSSPASCEAQTPLVASPHSSLSSPIPSPAPVAKRRSSSKKGEKSDRPKKPKKSRSKSTDSGKGSQSSPGVSGQPPALTPLLYLCEWNGCNRAFELFKSFTIHVNRTHLDMRSDKGLCHWTGCDQLIRQKWSLITHIQEKHLNEPIARAAAVKRQQNALTSRNTPPIIQPSAPPPVYPDDAALQAIRRFTIKPPYTEFTEMKEGPVTKHIRLTSALILRNLARYSALGRSELKKYEHQLAYVALSPVESSAAVSNCLYELHKHYMATTTKN